MQFRGHNVQLQTVVVHAKAVFAVLRTLRSFYQSPLMASSQVSSLQILSVVALNGEDLSIKLVSYHSLNGVNVRVLGGPASSTEFDFGRATSLLARDFGKSLRFNIPLSENQIAHDHRWLEQLVVLVLVQVVLSEFELQSRRILINHFDRLPSEDLLRFHGPLEAVRVAFTMPSADWRVVGDHLAKEAEFGRHKLISLSEQRVEWLT